MSIDDRRNHIETIGVEGDKKVCLDGQELLLDN